MIDSEDSIKIQIFLLARFRKKIFFEKLPRLNVKKMLDYTKKKKIVRMMTVPRSTNVLCREGLYQDGFRITVLINNVGECLILVYM